MREKKSNNLCSMALKGIKVLEFGGLAPGPFCGMVLADFGAAITRIDRIGANVEVDCVGNGKSSLALNVKSKEGVNIIKKLSRKSDVVIEPFRPGVMEGLGLGPKELLQENPRLIYARLTGYGDKGAYSPRAGHDINYLGLSGILSLFGRAGENPIAPVNLAADFAGGGLMCAFGIILALLERQSSNMGQVIDCNMVEGAAYVGSWLYRSQHLPIWGNSRGNNILDTGRYFYETYETKDGKYMAVGALEPQFYAQVLKGLELKDDEISQFDDNKACKKVFREKFLQKTQAEWCKIFDKTDACVTPILSLEEAPSHPHNAERNTFVVSHETGQLVPGPAPRLSRTPGISRAITPAPKRGQHTISILQDLGYTSSEITKLENMNVIETYQEVPTSKL
ncbi:alpha-methylacyl-CoA racemase isoform X2 [Photinus pyralis]|uniref:alpha-methylacyl-CoA racemase isoform X2 n=1 Tax=Photinus pyralis TaxID=7054 RepID=UPI0012677334|nr:alpha-methylacyl-CoA racemase isoform X2 [Photinus pyralis]